MELRMTNVEGWFHFAQSLPPMGWAQGPVFRLAVSGFHVMAHLLLYNEFRCDVGAGWDHAYLQGGVGKLFILIFS